MTGKGTSTQLLKRFWRRFDRWALVVFLVMQVLFWGLRLASVRDAAAVSRARHETERRTAPQTTLGGGDDASVSQPAPSGQTPRSVKGSTPSNRKRPIVASPISAGAGRRLRTPASVFTAGSRAAWNTPTRSPSLDIRELPGGYELRLSVPGRGAGARAQVQGSELVVEVPVFNARGECVERWMREIMLPSELSAAFPPRIDQTNGILRVYVAKAEGEKAN